MLRGGANPTRPWRDFDVADGEATFWYKPPAGQRKGGVSMSAGATESSGTDAALLDMEFPDPRFFSAGLADTDPDIFAAIQKETERQQDKLEMIASENIVSRAVLEAQGSILTNKYAEGCASSPPQATSHDSWLIVFTIITKTHGFQLNARIRAFWLLL